MLARLEGDAALRVRKLGMIAMNDGTFSVDYVLETVKAGTLRVSVVRSNGGGALL